MALNIHFYNRTIKDLKENRNLGFNDPEGILGRVNPKLREAFLANPFIKSDDDICQVIALDGNRVIGSELVFRNKYMADGEIRDCVGASTLYVSEPYRKEMVGADLMIKAATLYEKQDNIVAGISQIAYPIYKAMRYGCFSFPRFIFLNRSRSVISSFVRVKALSWVLSLCVDICLKLYHLILFHLILKRNYKVEITYEIPQVVEDIVMQDTHKYKELHDKKWFEWNINHTFSTDGRNKKQLYLIKESNEVVGFFVLKTEFFKEAGGRFRNLMLGSVAEWGIKIGSSLSEYQLHLAALRQVESNIDGVQVATTDAFTAKMYKRSIFMPMGIANNAVFMTSDKNKDIKKAENWRIRIAAGDTLID